MSIKTTPAYTTYNREQNLWAIFPEGYSPEAVIRGQAAAFKCQTLYKSGGTWYEKDHTEEASDTEITEAYFVPVFRVRFFTVGPYSGNPSPYGYKLHFDLPYAANVIDDFIWGTTYYKNVSKIRLDSNTTAERVNLYG